MKISRARAALTVGAAIAVLAAASCGGSSGGSNPSSPPVSVTPAPSTTASSPAPAPAAPARNPLTGIGGDPTTAVIAVKIDDTAPGRPQVGIDKADVVYIEAVEGGLTRLAAIFGTNKPTVGYVRSTRPSDPDLLLQYGKITEAYSGGAHDSLPRVRSSGITSWSNDAGAPYYTRVIRSASSYINLELNLAQVAKKTKSNRPRSNGWTFRTSLAGLSTTSGTNVRTTVTGSYAHGTAVQFIWDPKLRKYVRYINGVRQFAADGKPITATNVIVQSCKIVSHPQDTDVNGNPSQFTTTTGTGKVSVFRDGKRINGTWSRPHLASGTSLRAGGKALPLHPGNTWVVLIRNGIAVQG